MTGYGGLSMRASGNAVELSEPVMIPREGGAGAGRLMLRSPPRNITEEQAYLFHERAAILEHCAGMFREEAEELAAGMVAGDAGLTTDELLRALVGREVRDGR